MDTAPLPPLPPLHARWEHLSAEPVRGVMTLRGLFVDWGALKLSTPLAETKGIPTGGKLPKLEASGGVSLERGAESIRAARLSLDPDAGHFTASDAVFTTPPLRLAARLLERDPQRMRFEELTLTPVQKPRELRIAAHAGEFSYDDHRLTLRGAALSLYGLRIVTVPRLTFVPPGAGGGGGQTLSLPLKIHQSRISGLVTGVEVPFSLYGPVHGDAALDRSTRRGFQWQARVRADLMPPDRRGDGDTFFGGGAPGESPLRRLLRSPDPPRPKLVNSFVDILNLQPLLMRPPNPRRDIWITAVASHNLESVRRNVEVLLSRRPEVSLAGRAPLGTDGTVMAEATGGTLQERGLDGVLTESGRRTLSLQGAAPTWPLARGLRLQAQALQSVAHYDAGQVYRVREERLVAEAPLGGRSGISAGWIERQASGFSPFRFDRIEAPAEGQLRLQAGVGGLIVAVGTRWDLRAQRPFDTELGLALAGQLVEPHLTYRTQGRRIGLTLAFPGISL